MKHILALLLLTSSYLLASGQDDGQETFLQTNSKTHLYYVHLRHAGAIAFKMGSYFDKAGSGYSIRGTDTLTRNSEGLYAGKNIKLLTEGNKLYLIPDLKGKKRLALDTARSLSVVNHNLNNAYFLDQYFQMSDTLNKAYPLNHHSFRTGFYAWEELPNKEVDYVKFRAFTNRHLQTINDSISQQQDSYVSLTQRLVQGIGTMDYPALRDSLLKLPPAYRGTSGYYARVIHEVAKQRPAYFFRLAEDYPSYRSMIFMAVEDSKEVIQGLKAVEGHNDVKKEFFKDRKFGKTMPYRIIGVYVVIAGILTFLIISQ